MPSLESEDLESEDLEGQEDRERSTGLSPSVSSWNSNSVVALCDALTMSYLANIVYTTTALLTSEHSFTVQRDPSQHKVDNDPLMGFNPVLLYLFSKPVQDVSSHLQIMELDCTFCLSTIDSISTRCVSFISLR